MIKVLHNKQQKEASPTDDSQEDTFFQSDNEQVALDETEEEKPESKPLKSDDHTDFRNQLVTTDFIPSYKVESTWIILCLIWDLCNSWLFRSRPKESPRHVLDRPPRCDGVLLDVNAFLQLHWSRNDHGNSYMFIDDGWSSNWMGNPRTSRESSWLGSWKGRKL